MSANGKGLSTSVIAVSVCSNSSKRSVAPAARIISPHTCAIVLTLLATIAAYKTNEASSPPVITPSLTWRAPSHKTKIIVPITAVIITAVSNALTLTRLIAVKKLNCALSVKRFVSRVSCVYDCTVGMAFKISPAMAELSAIRSCDSRESFLTERPMSMIGKIKQIIKPILIENR